jgi:hypothetical protein
MVNAHVPAHVGTDKKTGDTFEYGDYDVQLADCPTCGGVYADMSQHAETPRHKAARLAAS